MFAAIKLTHIIARGGHCLTKQNLTNVNGDIFVSIDRFSDLSCT